VLLRFFDAATALRIGEKGACTIEGFPSRLEALIQADAEAR
jgi:hypothetical protein